MFVLKTMTFHLLDGISQMSLNCVKWVSLLPDLELRLTSRIQVRTVSEEVSQQKALAARGPQLRPHTPAASRLPQHCPWVTLTDSLQARDSGWHRLSPAPPPACLPSLPISLQRRHRHANTQPPSTRGQASSSVCSSCSICPTLSAVFEQPTRSPFICSAVAISPELPIISSSSTKNRGSLETRLSLAEISLSQWVVNAPIMLAFLILCYYYPRLPFSLQRIKRQGFQGRTMALCICQRLDKQYLCVSALLETSLLWESGCVRPPVRQRGGVSVCPPTQLPSQQHVHPQLPGNQHRSAPAQRQR